jgi:hypothetical protein
MVAALFIVITALIIAGMLLTVVIVAWGSLTWREIPMWSGGHEPSTVRLLPEVDIPLDVLEDDDPA